jgi:hypothetical protein
MYHGVIEREGSAVIDFSECYYIDQEGIRWLAAAKAGQKASLADRRRIENRRELERREAADRKRASGRRRKRDRRQRSEF